MVEVIQGVDLEADEQVRPARKAYVRDGVVAMDDALSPDRVALLAEISAARLAEIEGRFRSLDGGVFDGKQRFSDVQTRSPRRVDLRFSGDAHDAMVQAHFDLTGVEVLVSDLLGPSKRCLVTGSIVSAPGARAQHWHRDGGQGLFPEQPLPTPPYALTVMAPVIGFGPTAGPPEFDLGAWLVDADDPVPAIAPSSSGTALIFDYRARHRGGANRSTSIRHYVYWVWARPWFVDHLNYFGPTLSDPDRSR